MIKYKNLKISLEAKNRFDQLSKVHSMTQIELFTKMIDFFEAQKSLLSNKDELVLNKLEEMEKNSTKHFNRIIGFMKVQENDFILPIIEKSNLIAEQINDLIINHILKGESMESMLPYISEENKEKNKEQKKEDNHTLNELKKSGHNIKEIEERYKKKLTYLKERIKKLLSSIRKKNTLSGFILKIENMNLQEIYQLRELVENI